jgi:hypothetical protein
VLEATDAVDAFFSTEFEGGFSTEFDGGRHQRRLGEISLFETGGQSGVEADAADRPTTTRTTDATDATTERQ